MTAGGSDAAGLLRVRLRAERREIPQVAYRRAASSSAARFAELVDQMFGQAQSQPSNGLHALRAADGRTPLHHRLIASYYAVDGEFPTDGLNTLLRSRGYNLLLPVIEARNSMTFAEWTAEDDLSPNRFGIPEPQVTAQRHDPSDIAVIVVPCVGVDLLGNRLGMGGGYYDRALARSTPGPATASSDPVSFDAEAAMSLRAAEKKPLLVALAFECQVLDHIQAQPWDIPVDAIITEDRLVVINDRLRESDPPA